MTDQNRQNASEFPEVLIVSADLGLTRFLTEGLLPEGFWPSAVRSGLQALEVFRLRTFDAVLIDAALSDLPVDVLVDRLRETHDAAGEEVRHTASTSMLLIAGIPQELEPYHLETMAPDALFVAPFELEDLVERLRQITRKRTVD